MRIMFNIHMCACVRVCVRVCVQFSKNTSDDVNSQVVMTLIDTTDIHTYNVLHNTIISTNK